jgi:S-DNA-T family DNA segregation ATPase FtsK/SpoIIIE
MKRAPDVTIRLILEPPAGPRRDVAVTAQASAPARDIAAALMQELGLDPARHRALAVRVGRSLEAGSIGSLGLRQADIIRVVQGAPAAPVANAAPSGASSLPVAPGRRPLVELAIREPGIPPRTVALPAGEHTIGRGGGPSPLTLADPGVSAEHAMITVRSSGATITDLGATNGTRVGGTRLAPRSSSPLPLPARLELGRTSIDMRMLEPRTAPQVVQQAATAAASRAGAGSRSEPITPGGDILFNRPPRVLPQVPVERITLAAPPEEPAKGRISIATSLVPLVMAIVVVAATGQAMYALFALMSPAIAIASYAEERFTGRRGFKPKAEKFRTGVDGAVGRALGLRQQEAERLRAASPDVRTLAARIHRAAPGLWERTPADPDFLMLRVGLAARRSNITVEVERGGSEALQQWAVERSAERAELQGVPALVDLAEAGSVGLVGSPAALEALARSLVVQAAALFSPIDLGLAFIVSADGARTWDWVKWLPHIRTDHSPLRVASLAGPAETSALVDDLLRLRSERISGTPRGSGRTTARSFSPWMLLIVDGRVPMDRPAISGLMADCAEAGIVCVWLGDRIEDLPGECRVVLSVGADGVATRNDMRTGDLLPGITADVLAAEDALSLSLALAPIRDVTAHVGDGGLPTRVGLLEELDAPKVGIEGWMAQAWGTPRDHLGVPIGESASGPLILDLERHGPHGLVAGTTGSGKSELLQTLVGAMAALYPPSRVTFLLVDYKGGTAFGGCRGLPHTVGYVTDLDPSLTTRALISLNAELRRREGIIAASGSKDLTKLRATDPAKAPASLCIVVDEYAALLKEQPDFVEGIVDVAQRGRALGVHLVLGTQSPDLTVSQKIQDNIGFRIALRTAKAAGSSAVIGTDLAAGISLDQTGRAYIRFPSGDLQYFQTAWANAPIDGSAGSGVRVAEFGFRVGSSGSRSAMPSIGRSGSSTGGGATAGQTGPTDLTSIADAAAKAFRASGAPAPHRPWLPALPEVLPLAALRPGMPAQAAPLGLVDEPERQRQTVTRLDLDAHGGLVVTGMSGSGKTTLLRSAALGLAERAEPGCLHLYGLDFGAGGLRMLEALPGCGAVVQGDDLERSVRLLRMLRREVADRRARLAQGGLTFTDALHSPVPTTFLPRIVVVLDGYDGFTSAFERVAFGEWVDATPRIVADGRSVGVHFLISAGRRFAVPSAIIGILDRRVVLRQAEPDEYFQSGIHVDARQLPSLPPGRGFTETGSLIQTPVAGGASDANQAAAIGAVAAALRQAAASAPVQRPLPSPIGRMPQLVRLASLPAGARGEAFPIGIGDNALAPVGFRPDDGHVLVAGPGRSGRTSTLLALAAAIRRSDPSMPIHFLSPRSVVPESLSALFDVLRSGFDECAGYLAHQGWEARPNAGAETVGVAGAAHPAIGDPASRPPVVLIDDADEMLDAMGVAPLVALMRRRPAPGPWFVVALEPDVARKNYPDWLPALKKHRNGLLLSPDIDVDGDLLNVRLPRHSTVASAPGRGYIVHRESVELVQIALA